MALCSVVLFFAAVFSAAVAIADMPADEIFQERIEVPEPRAEAPRPAAPVEHPREVCRWGTRLSGGVPIWFFDKEDTKAAGGAYLDVIPCEV